MARKSLNLSGGKVDVPMPQLDEPTRLKLVSQDKQVRAKIAQAIVRQDAERVRRGEAPTGRLSVARGQTFATNFAHLVQANGLNRRQIQESVRRLLDQGYIDCSHDGKLINSDTRSGSPRMAHYWVTDKLYEDAS